MVQSMGRGLVAMLFVLTCSLDGNHNQFCLDLVNEK